MTERGSTLLEFAIAWPVAMAMVFGGIQIGLWGSEVYAARAAALAGARAGAASSGNPATAQAVALVALRPSLLGVRAAPWCPEAGPPQPPVWVCGRAGGGAVEVVIGGSVPALFPVIPGGGRLPVAADAVLPVEAFAR